MNRQQHHIVPALICIPDLAGFTRFMKDSEIGFSVEVIPRLLKSIIESNDLDLELSEVEGDAVLFYRPGPPPSLESILAQAQNFFTGFARSLNLIKKEYADTYHKNVTSGRLGLKIIMHYGNITLARFGRIVKLFGEDVITAHRLLKNHIKIKEYLLLSESLIKQFPETEAGNFLVKESAESGNEKYDHIGKVKFYFISFEHLNGSGGQAA